MENSMWRNNKVPLPSKKLCNFAGSCKECFYSIREVHSQLSRLSRHMTKCTSPPSINNIQYPQVKVNHIFNTRDEYSGNENTSRVQILQILNTNMSSFQALQTWKSLFSNAERELKIHSFSRYQLDQQIIFSSDSESQYFPLNCAASTYWWCRSAFSVLLH